MFKVLRNGLLRYILHTCPNLWCNSCSKCYGMDCFGTDFTHVQTCDVTRVQSATQYDCFGAYFTHCFGVRLSVFGFRFSAFGFWPSACGFRFSSFGFRLPASCFVCTTSAFGFRLSAFVAWIPNPVRLSGSCLSCTVSCTTSFTWRPRPWNDTGWWL